MKSTLIFLIFDFLRLSNHLKIYLLVFLHIVFRVLFFRV